MTTSRKWSPLVTFALLTVLLAVSVGPSGGAAEPRVTNKTITIPAGAFSITDDAYDFHNDGRDLYLEAGYGAFSAPLFFESRQVTGATPVGSLTLVRVGGRLHHPGRMCSDGKTISVYCGAEA
jgi:hypothetical protein